MGSEDREGDKLYSRLREVLGSNQAATLMGLLPDQEQFATKRDILALKSDIAHLDGRVDKIDGRMDQLDGRIDRLETSIDKVDDRLWNLHEALRTQTRVYITATVSSMIGVGALSFAAAALV